MTPTPNIPALRKAVEFAETSHSLYGGDPIDAPLAAGMAWYQPRYSMLLRNPDFQDVKSGKATAESCGTAYCVAGFTVAQLPGYRAEIVIDPYYETAHLRETLDGHHLSNNLIYQAACDELGLTDAQASALFFEDNSIRDVRRIAEEIAGEKL